MKSILTVQDLAHDTELGKKEMTAVRGGIGNQANGTSQNNVMAAFSPVSVGNGSLFGGGANIQADSKVDQTASNWSESYNDKANVLALVGLPC